MKVPRPQQKKTVQDDFFASYATGLEVAGKQRELKLKQQEAQLKFYGQMQKQQLAQQRLQLDMAKAGIRPPSTPGGSPQQLPVGSFNPFTGIRQAGHYDTSGQGSFTPLPGAAGKPRPLSEFDTLMAIEAFKERKDWNSLDQVARQGVNVYPIIQQAIENGSIRQEEVPQKFGGPRRGNFSEPGSGVTPTTTPKQPSGPSLAQRTKSVLGRAAGVVKGSAKSTLQEFRHRKIDTQAKALEVGGPIIEAMLDSGMTVEQVIARIEQENDPPAVKTILRVQARLIARQRRSKKRAA